ncbi:hypothetical protein [Ornithinimicrobium kibberense]|uniref:hypothetical protein n=1 Tax=Ornithinimicrobium kibberense TaxID=282060 RepID=UPI00360A4AEF
MCALNTGWWSRRFVSASTYRFITTSRADSGASGRRPKVSSGESRKEPPSRAAT